MSTPLIVPIWQDSQVRMLVLGLALSVELGGAFGEASASGHQLAAQLLEVDLSVSVPGGGSVVAHVIEPGGPQRTLAMANRGGEVFGTIFETRPVDLVVVFEVVAVDRSEQSAPVTLTELGLDPALLGTLPARLEGPGGDEGLAVATRRWGWLGLALAAGALSLLALWALGGEDRRKEASEDELVAEAE